MVAKNGALVATNGTSAVSLGGDTDEHFFACVELRKYKKCISIKREIFFCLWLQYFLRIKYCSACGVKSNLGKKGHGKIGDGKNGEWKKRPMKKMADNFQHC